jgi:AcrR family transcriptional regulator
VARWDPDGGERLARAALELFGERGFEATTVADITQRAGLTKSTFFRHFDDKREVLFSGQEPMVSRLRETAAAIPPDAPPLDVVAALLAVLVAFLPPERREAIAARAAVIRAHPELRERELLKRAELEATIADAVRARAVDDATARLAASMGLLALETATARWTDGEDDRALGEQVAEALHDLVDRALRLAPPGSTTA